MIEYLFYALISIGLIILTITISDVPGLQDSGMIYNVED